VSITSTAKTESTNTGSQKQGDENSTTLVKRTRSRSPTKIPFANADEPTGNPAPTQAEKQPKQKEKTKKPNAKTPSTPKHRFPYTNTCTQD
jgi:hypothetical protein